MKKLFFVVAAALAFSATPTQAASLYVNFCPGDSTCPASLTEASLTFTEGSDPGDINDYFVDLKIAVGADVVPALYVDEVSFTVDGVTYEALPTLQSAPGGVGVWSVFNDTIANAADCGAPPQSGQSICAESVGAFSNGPQLLLANSPYVWRFLLDISGTTKTLGAGASVNLRAKFVDANGTKVGDLLSPSGGTLNGGNGGTNGGGDVPEPTSMALIGLGLIGAGLARRRK